MLFCSKRAFQMVEVHKHPKRQNCLIVLYFSGSKTRADYADPAPHFRFEEQFSVHPLAQNAFFSELTSWTYRRWGHSTFMGTGHSWGL